MRGISSLVIVRHKVGSEDAVWQNVADNYYQKVNAERICWYFKRLWTPGVSPLHMGVWEVLLWNGFTTLSDFNYTSDFDYTVSRFSLKIQDCDKCNVKSCSNENMAKVCLDRWED